MPLWHYIDERVNAKEDGELYSDVADLYHRFRPRYPEELIEQATAGLEKEANILEIGCGPATATLPLLERGFRMTCIEPSSGMIEKAKILCRDYSQQVSFHQMTLDEFSDESSCYDAILAASSFHWAMDSDGTFIRKCHRLLKPNGNLILMWNLPPEPEQCVRDKVAAATLKTVPFYFGGYSISQHQENIHDKILVPVETTGLFTHFSSHHYRTEASVTVQEYISFLQTLTSYIKMPDEERNSFFQRATETMTALCGHSVGTMGISILNVSTKINGENSQWSKQRADRKSKCI